MICLNRLIDKIALTMLGLSIAVVSDVNSASMIIALLTAVIVSSVSQYTSCKIIFYAVHGIYSVLSLFFPELLFFLALSVYEIIYSGTKYAKITVCILPFMSFYKNSFISAVTVVVVCFVAVLLSVRSSENEKLNEKIITQRDSSEENQKLLLERNKYLSIGRDNEVNLAVMSERNRIARDIHDNVGHTLSRLILQMGALKVINKDADLKPHLEEISKSLDSAMTSMRESVHNLHDDSVLLGKTVKELIKPLEKNFTLKLDMDISEKASKEIKFALIGIIREAVSNIIRHSNGDKVIIIMREHPGFYQLSVEDNGKNNGIINNEGIGLDNMKSRTDKFNGIFKYYIEKDKFKIFVSIPKVKE